MPEMVRERWCCVLGGTQHKKNIAADTGDDPIPAAVLLHLIDTGRIGNCSVLYFKAGYCFVFVNYNGKLRRRKRIFSYITEKYGELS